MAREQNFNPETKALFAGGAVRVGFVKADGMVIPIDIDSGKPLDGVVFCMVESSLDSVTRLTITLNAAHKR